MGSEDIKAALAYILDHQTNTMTKFDKVGLVGYSMGTSSIYAALAIDYDWFKDRVYKVAQIAPCTISSPEQYTVFNAATVNGIESFGMYAFGGTDWYETMTKFRNYFGFKLTVGFLGMGWGSAIKDVSLKSIYHYAQNSKENRFQKYSDSYWSVWPFKVAETELYDLSVITETPIGLFIGELDPTCLPKWNEVTKNEIGDSVEFYQFYKGYDHGTFVYKMNNPIIQQDMLNFFEADYIPHSGEVPLEEQEAPMMFQ